MHVYEDIKSCICEMIPKSKVKYFIERQEVVNQIITLKWCYILLNGIHPLKQKGKAFANEGIQSKNLVKKEKVTSKNNHKNNETQNIKIKT